MRTKSGPAFAIKKSCANTDSDVEVSKQAGRFKDKVRNTTLNLRERVSYILYTPFRVFKWICFWTGFSVLFFILSVGIYLQSILHTLPNMDRISFDQLKQLSEQKILARLEDQTQMKLFRWTDINEINRDYLYSIVMSEDATFFEHEGLDFDAILNSMAENLKRKKYEYGASTISQQVVKNLFLTNEKSLVRKIKEFVLTERLERRLSKNQILELYLNVAEFGPDLFGIRRAAEIYFKKTPAQINAAEGAFIALMLPSPRKNYYAIYQNKNLAPTKFKKMKRVLGDMLANEYISHQQFLAYLHYPFFKESTHQELRQRKVASKSAGKIRKKK